MSTAPDRKQLIADTAIALLAELGARGLTHRAVDARAGLPGGSTSFYCRTRADLLSLALNRHASLDLAELEQDASRWHTKRPTLDEFVDALVSRIADWLSEHKRDRLVAKFELFLIASRTPELMAAIEPLRDRFLEATTSALSFLDISKPHEVAPVLMMTVDAILFGQVSHQSPPFDPAHCRRIVRHVILMTSTQQD